MSLGLDDLDHAVDVLFADLFRAGLDHHADDRLGAALAHEDAAGVAELLGDLCDRGLHVGVVLRLGLGLDAHVLEHLRVEHDGRGQLAHGLFLIEHDLHELQARQDAVARGRVLGEDHVAGLLAADLVAVLDHVLVDVLVADLGLLIADVDRVERLVQAEVRHDGGDDLVVRQLPVLLHVQTADIDRVVARDDVALFIHADAAVRVAVVGKADIQAVA